MKVMYVDFDGTLVRSNSFHYVHAVLLAHYCANKNFGNALRVCLFYFALPLLMLAHGLNASLRDRLTYAFYYGLAKEQLEKSLAEYFQRSDQLLIEETAAYIKMQRAAGYAIVIVSGSIREVIEAALNVFSVKVDAIICAELEFRSETCRGSLIGQPMVDRQKSRAIQQYEAGQAIAHRIAVSDSLSDRHLLELAQHKIVVNPSRRLDRIAQKNGWERWTTFTAGRSYQETTWQFQPNDWLVLFHGSLWEQLELTRWLWQQRNSIRGFIKSVKLARRRTLGYWKRSWKDFPIQNFADQIIAASHAGKDKPGQRIRLHVFNPDHEVNRWMTLNLSDLIESNHTGTLAAIREQLKIHFHQKKYEVRWQDPDGIYFTLNKATIVEQLRQTSQVKNAMAILASEKSGVSVEKIFQSYCSELIPQRSYTVFLMLRRVIKWVFDRLYVEIKVEGLERLKELDRHYQLVYLPTHRSHFDFLIAPLKLYYEGIQSPYIAASNHLNTFPVRYLQKISAFFIRRQKMDVLYNSMMFNLFRIHQQYGFSQQVFIEGTRSKTGITLAPKIGIMSQYIDAYVTEQKRPLVFVPVHISYDYVVEGDSFFEEIVKHKKGNGTLLTREEKEFDAYRINHKNLSALTKLKFFWKDLKHFSRKGRAYISYGRPVYLQDYIDHSGEPPADVHEQRSDGIPHPWIRQIAKQIGVDICVELNRNAPITLTSVVSTAIIASHRFALPEKQVENFVELTGAIFQEFGLKTENIALHPNAGEYTYINRDRRRPRSLVMKRQNAETGCRRVSGAVVSHYYFSSELDRLRANLVKNNIMHHYIIPSMVSNCLTKHGTVNLDQLDEYLALRYEPLRAEFHLPWTLSEAREMVRKVIAVFESRNFLIRFENGQDVYFRSVSQQESCPLSLFAGAVELGSDWEKNLVSAE